MKKHIITVLMSNKSGVLTRITGLFARRGFNIDSLVVCNTENEQTSRMTMVVTAEEAIVAQIIKQLDKLFDVVKVTELDPENSVSRELMMIKVNVSAAQRSEIDTTCTIYKAEIIDLSPESVVIELTGKSSKLDAFIELMRPYGIIEMTRTGLNALHRGKESINGD